jgi:hypothetical protein
LAIVGVEAGLGFVHAVDVQTGEIVYSTGTNPFNFAGRLHLSENGIIVAAWLTGDSPRLWSDVVPGKGLPAPHGIERADVGLQDSYPDSCTDCPRMYAIDRTGAVLGWLEGDDLVLHSLATETLRRVPLGGRAGGATSIDIELGGEGDLGGPLVVAIEYGGDVPNGIVVDVGDNGVTDWPIGTPERVSLSS